MNKIQQHTDVSPFHHVSLPMAWSCFGIPPFATLSRNDWQFLRKTGENSGGFAAAVFLLSAPFSRSFRPQGGISSYLITLLLFHVAQSVISTAGRNLMEHSGRKPIMFDNERIVKCVNQKISKQLCSESSIKDDITGRLSIMRSAISDVVKFPVRNQITFGGLSRSMDRSKKSESKVTMVKPFCLANCHISQSSQSSNPTLRTCWQSEKVSGSNRSMRYEMFWSNNSFISSILQVAFSFSSKSETSKNILLCQLGKIRKDIIVGHARRQPTQNIINGDTGVPYARLSETFFGINANDVVKNIHNNYV